MTIASRLGRALAAAVLLASVVPGAALAAVGHVASVEGTAEIGRDGVFSLAETGTDIDLGDELRTTEGRMRVVFQDDSVLNIAENTRLVVDSQVFDPDQDTFSSALRLLSGKVRAAVSAYYQEPGAEFEVETPTAVAGVRGTTFLISYDEALDVTEVLGIRGRVHVRSLDERLGDGVFVTAKEATTVAPGEAPEPPAVLDDLLFRERLDSLEVLGRVEVGGLASGAALQTGGEVAPADRAPVTGAEVTSLDDLRDASDVVGQPLPVVETTRGRLGVPF
jgi:hypothetical protein